MDLAPPVRRRRLVSLTPMIDVVFLLLIFFMLTSNFAPERTMTLTGAGGGEAEWSGAPRLIEVTPDRITFNGRPATIEMLERIAATGDATGGRPLLLRMEDGASVQRLTDVLDALNAAGSAQIVLLP